METDGLFGVGPDAGFMEDVEWTRLRLPIPVLSVGLREGCGERQTKAP